MPEPIEISLYDPKTNEKLDTFVRSYVPWEIMKTALRLQKNLNPDDLAEKDVDELAALVVATFGDEFSIEQVNKGMDIGEMLTVLDTIIKRAEMLTGGRKGNPTTAAKRKRR